MERSGGLVKYFLNYWSACSHSLFYKTIVFLRRSWKYGRHSSNKLLINQLNVVAIPVSFLISFVVLELTRSLMAIIYSEFASISHRVTKCPRNLLELTPKVHLVALNLSLCSLRIATTSTRSFKRSGSYLLLTIISSMYTSMVYPLEAWTSW